MKKSLFFGTIMVIVAICLKPVALLKSDSSPEGTSQAAIAETDSSDSDTANISTTTASSANESAEVTIQNP